jgi:spermidine synthase
VGNCFFAESDFYMNSKFFLKENLKSLDFSFLFKFSSFFYFVSGATSLVYQVIWMKEMTLFFGSDIIGTSITIASFMAGLAIGALLMGFVIDKIKRYLLTYGVIEVFIGLYALFLGGFVSFLEPQFEII